MSNTLSFYGLDNPKTEQDFDSNIDYFLADSPGHVVPILWAAFFEISDLKVSTFKDEWDDELTSEVLIVSREEGLKRFTNRMPTLKKLLPNHCHQYLDDWYVFFKNELDIPYLMLSLDELIYFNDEEREQLLDLSEEGLQNLLNYYNENSELDTFDILVGGCQIDEFDWPFEERNSLF